MVTGLNWDEDGNQGGLLNSRSARKCLSDQEVEDFLFDRLSGVTREVVEEHLLACQDCLSKVEKEEEYVQTVRAAARTLESEELERAFDAPHAPQAPERKAPGWDWPRWGLALGGAAVLIAAFVQFRPAPLMTEAEIALRVERSAGELGAVAAAGQPLRLTPDLAGLPAATELEWAVVDASGRTAGTARFAAASGAPGIKLPGGLKAGMYWVRIQRPGGVLLREFALRVR